MQNFRYLAIVVNLGLIFFAALIFIVAKFLEYNLQVSQKYEEIDLNQDIIRAQSIAQISFVFLLILSVMFVGVLVFSKNKK